MIEERPHFPDGVQSSGAAVPEKKKTQKRRIVMTNALN